MNAIVISIHHSFWPSIKQGFATPLKPESGHESKAAGKQERRNEGFKARKNTGFQEGFAEFLQARLHERKIEGKTCGSTWKRAGRQ
jgi:hypothetical protein